VVGARSTQVDQVLESIRRRQAQAEVPATRSQQQKDDIEKAVATNIQRLGRLIPFQGMRSQALDNIPRERERGGERVRPATTVSVSVSPTCRFVPTSDLIPAALALPHVTHLPPLPPQPPEPPVAAVVPCSLAPSDPAPYTPVTA
jgi:hypothetical protein